MATPLSIPPSEYWDGIDGRWSTFWVEIGTPAQAVRLLPGTSATACNSFWTVLAQGCAIENPGLANCEFDRGFVFQSNESTSWSTERLANGGLYSLTLYEESQLRLSGNAYFGFDTVKLSGPSGDSLPTLQNQLIAGIGTNDFWIGSLGLSPWASNFSDFDDPVPSLLGSLRHQNSISSSTWAYTAGAPYQNPLLFGSLTLGGFDASRRSNESTVSIPFGNDVSRDLLVGLQSITYDAYGSPPLLADGIYAFIDSLVAELWLPIIVCEAFEKAFNLTWNATAEMYFVDESQHAALIAQNPTFTFTVGPSTSGGESAQLVFPYAAFDFNLTGPGVASSTRTFPLKRASNETTYTLGRAFLQEAYVVADYDRGNFSVSQALYPEDGTPMNLIAIEAPQRSQSDVPSTLSTTSRARALTGAMMAGITVAAVVLLALVAVFAIFFVCRSRRKKRNTSLSPALVEKDIIIAESDGDEAGRKELNGENGVHEIESGRGFHEADDASRRIAELEGHGKDIHEADDQARLIAEVDGGDDRKKGADEVHELP